MNKYVNNIENLKEIMGYKIVSSTYKVLYGQDIYDGYISYNGETLYFMLYLTEGNKSIYVVYRKETPFYKFSLLKKE